MDLRRLNLVLLVLGFVLGLVLGAGAAASAEATVLEVGISDIDANAATVLVAADTAVTSKATSGRSRTVPWLIKLDMVNEDGRWLTAGLQFVG